MAKKNKGKQTPPPQQGISKPESFTHGMVSDLAPHFQLSGSYSDAQNIGLTNSEGDTFTVENIEGNSLFVDLASYPISSLPDQGAATNYPTFRDRGPDAGNISANPRLDNRSSIVGHVSYANQLLLMIVARSEYDRNFKLSSSDVLDILEKDRTIFLMVDFDHEFKIKKVTDLRVCYNTSGYQYPDLNMDLDTPVRIENIVENDSISRIYWTDNKNPLRTLNIKQPELHRLEVSSLNITPLMSPSQAVLSATLSGSLPVGVYQYTYKYISENGGESTFGPLSNMYHVSDQSFGSSTSYAGGPKGNLGTQGFQIDVKDIDDRFSHVELYSLFYDERNSPPRVSVVSRNQVAGATSTFQHISWNNEVENGLEEVLIESNTFDVCKDIAIKDNILFAANLRQKRNFISEKEWNVKVLRWRIREASGGLLDAMLTTSDPEIKHYQLDANNDPVPINSGAYDYDTKDDNDHRCGYGEVLGDPNGMFPAIAPREFLNWDGNLNVPLWTTAISNQRTANGGSSTYSTHWTYKYLSDRMTVGAESFNYVTNGLGGCRVSFGVEEKIADISQNAWNSPFVSSTSKGEELITEFYTTNDTGPYNVSGSEAQPSGNTTFKTSMSLGGSKDPHLSGNTRGYQRGEIYRFGVQIYDLNGAPGNVLWIGDIETPHQYDVMRMINIKNKSHYDSNYRYTPFRPTHYTSGSVQSLTETTNILSHHKISDHRLSFVYGHTVPPVDVEWFSGRLSSTYKNLDAYVRDNGSQRTFLPNNGSDRTQTLDGAKGLARAVPGYTNSNGESNGGPSVGPHDDTHYLFDLYVSFEFIIPDEVCKKISGFRVVRSERTEEDRRIIQQGLLNQTAQYGHAKLGQKYGYSTARFSQKDNEAFGDDPVFVNEWNDGESSSDPDPTLPEQPEYNVYLNGYLGLAENSYMAFWNDGVSNGKVTTGGSSDSDGKVFWWPEREDKKKHLTGGAGYPRGIGPNAGSYGGPGTYGEHFRHCGYFGSYDKMNLLKADGSEGEYNDLRARNEISGTVFTLDSPDSAFGIRPYTYREGDMLRIDDILKLTDEFRYRNDPGGTNPNHYYTNCRDNDKASSGWSHNDWVGLSGSEEWKPKDTQHPLDICMSFATRKDIDKDYSVLIGKYYSYDPYFAIGMETDGGAFIGPNKGRDGNTRPKNNYGWQLPISNSKEISDGEVIPNAFFKISKRVKEGRVSGFSNNTLGFVGKTQFAGNSNTPKTWYNTYAAVFESLPNKKGKSATDGQRSEVAEEDYTYDTVSTLQMGLRSILIEIDNRCSEVRKKGPNPEDTFFEIRPERSYTSWFAPMNVSALYEHGHWLGKMPDNTHSTSSPNSWNQLPYVSSWLSSKGTLTNQSIGTEEHDGDGDHTTYQKGKDLVPFKYLCSIVRNITPYGGYNKGSIEKTRYIPCGNFHPVGDSTGSRQGHISQVFGGDTFVNLYSHQKTSAPYMKKSAIRYQLFPVESYVNTDMRSGLTLNAGDTVIGKDMNTEPYSNDWLYNSIYSQENNIKSALMVNEDTFDESLNLPYEIAYSNTKILGQKSDAFRQFPINQFHDMEGLYGEINRIVNFKNEIYVLQDSAFAKLLVNPLSMLSDDAGTSLFTGTGETVENHIYISTKYGSRHRFSVAMSEKSLYFVDSNFGRLFKYDTEKLISLGDALGQRNYLKYIIKEWEQRAYRECPSSSGGGASALGNHDSAPIAHGTNYGRLDSLEKPTGSRNYFSDNPLNFLGITSIYDYKNKELLITFHNSAWGNKDDKRQTFARTEDNHSMGSTTNGEPVGISETLVYSEAINAFTSKYSVAPPQWLAGGQGSFILSPENEINVNSIANFNGKTGLFSTYSYLPYNIWGSYDGDFYRNRRCNPLRLWIWDKHKEKKKTHFFGKKDDIIEPQTTISSVGQTIGGDPVEPNIKADIVKYRGTKDVADESYIVKVINSEAANSKVFDNAKIVMTPKHVDFSFIDYTTDISHDTIKTKSIIPDQDRIYRSDLLDETEQLVINRRWDFDGTMHSWYFVDGSSSSYPTPILNTGLEEVVTSVQHNFGSGVDGKYFFFNETNMSNLLGNTTWHNTVVNMIQIRNGVEIWSGDVRLWDSTHANSVPTSGTGNSHGRREGGSASGQWQVGDIVRTSMSGSTITLEYAGDGKFRSPKKGEQINLPGKFNNIIRMRVKRTLDGGGWEGKIFWRGYDPIRKANGDWVRLGENQSRSQQVSEPEGIDNDFVIIEWDMSPTTDWNDCIIEQIRIDLSESTSTFEIDWIEIGGLKADKYIDGVLRVPLRTEKSRRRTRGTYAKIKYSAKTTEKFNIFAILAKYRKTY